MVFWNNWISNFDSSSAWKSQLPHILDNTWYFLCSIFALSMVILISYSYIINSHKLTDLKPCTFIISQLMCLGVQFLWVSLAGMMKVISSTSSPGIFPEPESVPRVILVADWIHFYHCWLTDGPRVFFWWLTDAAVKSLKLSMSWDSASLSLLHDHITSTTNFMRATGIFTAGSKHKV